MNLSQALPGPAVLSAPTLSSVSPGHGPVAGGTSATLTGASLTGATAVHFGAAAASFTVNSDSTIAAVAPPGSGNVQITVVTPGGTSNGVGYSYVPTPALSGAVPGQGPQSGGTTVMLTGSRLTGATAVKFGAAAASFTVVSDNQIAATAPPGAAGPVGITVTTPGGTTAANVVYFYIGIPTLTSAVPDQGPQTGGTSVTLTGTGLIGATAVKFGTAVASFTVISDSTVVAIAPPGSGTVLISVTTAGGTTAASVYYSYVGTPTLNTAVPNQGPQTGGTSVTLTGNNLTYVTTVKFGSAFASFTVISDSIAVSVAPPGSGTVQITVTTPGGTSNGLAYVYVPPPGI